MRKITLLFALVLVGYGALSQQSDWTPVNESAITKNLFTRHIKPATYQLYRLDEPSIQRALRSSPSERKVSAAQSSFILSVPVPGGQLERFSVVFAPVMDAALAARYPEIQSYAGKGVDNPTSTIRFDVSPRGFHGMILSANRPTIYIDPVDRDDKYYVVFSRQEVIDYRNVFQCFTHEGNKVQQPAVSIPGEGLRGADDGRLRTYRLALAATGEYSTYFLDGTETTDAQRKAKVLAAMNTLMTRTNGIYERDFGVRLNLIANNDAIIYLTASSDPWTNEYNTKTQQTIDAVIGSANYDIGHLVHRGSNNGNAGCIGCVCVAGQKGSAFTSHTTPEGDPFVVDYSTHEMGHQFGANHTFSFQTEGTGANMEPGSGSTIMGYAGITGSTTDVQPHSDDYFHAKSIEQVTDYIKGTTGGGCAVVTITGNSTPTANAGANFTIPRSTPFVLTGTGTDANAGDVLTYTWEQYDNYASGSSTVPSATATSGPQFRSVSYSTNPSRLFPNLASVLGGTNTNKWEVLPSVARTLNFRFTVRDNHSGGGNNNSDDMQVIISSAAGPFAVTAPNTAVTWAPGSSQAITWSVNSTNAAPVNCANVKISLSTDGGNTFPIVLLASTANDGTETITVPNNVTTQARVKIEAVGNIFYDISNTNFTISGTPPTCTAPAGLASSAITGTSATVSWTTVSGANSYDVDYKTTAASTWTNAATATTSTSVNLSGLTAATTYDWRVRANCASGSSSYSSAQFTTITAPGCTAAYEPNETQAAAAAVATNTALSAAIGSATDKDWYSFTLSATSNLNITLGNLAGDYDIILYNSAGTELARSENGGTTSETITRNNSAAGTYYIQVFGYNGAFSTTVCYNLNIGATTVTGCTSTYDNSTNGTFAGAPQVPLNTNITGLISPSGDNDYYRFVITTGGTITITLTGLPADYDIRLYNSAQTQVGISQAGGTSSETINYTAAAGTYYVRVYGYNNANNATVCYTLRVATGTASREGSPEYTATPKVTVFPNPVVSTLNVNIAGTTSRSVIKVLDVNGRLLINKPVAEGNTALDVKRYASGVYMLLVTDEKGRGIYQYKFVKE
ncbi:T9SS type A sorting domain-containing protein [Pseudoflavitalea sp. X16]|uniref:reprolysin-like metallopeptidase n=1 Tax=Paraflavitalea devenefica TaxID=2716334 RepID=UPI001420C486|nr:zinc-dependent metalloprotease family protein [Paraflavitalea devenefica]NII29842.1 T9SS type A sorting domain-containing protein [Paraflavitalea devenefica]